MASAVRGVWAIDLGSNALKAIRLIQGPEGPEVTAFDYIEHSAILSGEDVMEDEKGGIIAETLSTFASRNDLTKDEVAISIAGHNSFARFVKPPPVEAKRLPQLIPLEAVQQIPFDINEVEWDWQLMSKPDSPDAEVGIFAIKNEIINEFMDYFTAENMRVSCVQVAPMALYNYLHYDRSDLGGANQKATVIMDIGAEDTNLIVCTKTSVWHRTIRIGGNTFTEAIADSFNLSFTKAEKLKRTAPMSKYMRQIYTAMKPVYTELSTELQRSLGFYSNSGPGREKGFARVIAIGGGMKLQGLTRYLKQSLGIDVIKPDAFEKLKLSSEASSAKFHENITDFGVPYGLGVQVLEDAKIEVNLLPKKIARSMAWARKAKTFILAASILLVAAVLGFARVKMDAAKYAGQEDHRRQITAAITKANSASSKLRQEKSKAGTYQKNFAKQNEVFKNREILPLLNEALYQCFPNAENTPDQKDIFDAFKNSDVATLISYPRGERKQAFITSMSVNFTTSLLNSQFGETRKRRTSSPAAAGGTGMEMGMMDMYGMGGMGGYGPGGGGGGYGPGGYGPGAREVADTGADELDDGAGFVVVIEGYTPYEEFGDLMDPAGVGDDKLKWGVITRLRNFAEATGLKNFELFGPDYVVHFVVEKGDVEEGDGDMPVGIGVAKEIERVEKEEEKEEDKPGMMSFSRTRLQSASDRVETEKVLIDPMTNEEMSKTFDLVTKEDIAENPDYTERDLATKKFTSSKKEKYITRDKWFRIKAKFLWKDAPNLKMLNQKKAGTS